MESTLSSKHYHPSAQLSHLNQGRHNTRKHQFIIECVLFACWPLNFCFEVTPNLNAKSNLTAFHTPSCLFVTFYLHPKPLWPLSQQLVVRCAVFLELGKSQRAKKSYHAKPTWFWMSRPWFCHCGLWQVMRLEALMTDRSFAGVPLWSNPAVITGVIFQDNLLILASLMAPG